MSIPLPPKDPTKDDIRRLARGSRAAFELGIPYLGEKLLYAAIDAYKAKYGK